MNIKKEQIKIKIFLILYILFAIVFSILYRNSKKAIEENNK